ncbi:MAG: DUF2007 domain-containing protein [Acidobacteria bacterium]|jgi:hypothetical protein|nr:DUF2007 domain-containing protein [Acidobacteriota bacterium]
MNNELVIVATTFDPLEAEYLRNCIEEKCIEVFLADENIIATYGLLANAVGGIKLKVVSDDVAAASAIVEEIRAADKGASEDKNEDTGWGECPKCHGRKIKPYRAAFGWEGVLMFLGLPAGKPQRTLVCSNCANEWTDS